MCHPQWSPSIFLNIANHTSFSREQCTNTSHVQHLIHECIIAKFWLNTYISCPERLHHDINLLTLSLFTIRTTQVTRLLFRHPWKSMNHISLKERQSHPKFCRTHFNQYQGFSSCAGVTWRRGNALQQLCWGDWEKGECYFMQQRPSDGLALSM